MADGIGGCGPTQIGLGMSLNSIGSLLTQGSLQTTGQWSDLAISGEGYFAVAKEVTTSGNGALPAAPDVAFTRAGNFTTDKAGWLVTELPATTSWPQPPDGAGGFLPNELRGIKVDPNAQSVSIDQNGVVTFIDQAGVGPDRRPHRAGQVPEPGRPGPRRRQHAQADPELRHLRPGQPGRRGAVWGQPNAAGPRLDRRRPRWRCRTSTWRSSSPR